MFNISNPNTKLKWKKAVYIATICLIVLFLLVIITVFIIIPIAFMLSFPIQEHIMFTRFNLPRDKTYFELDSPGLRNFYVDVNDAETNNTISLGVWHLLPWSIVEEYENVTTEIDYEKLLANSSFNILIHFHGTGETRRDSFKMFNMLRVFFHVIAFDYRGYGDSSDGKMTEEAVVKDCKQLYKWIQKRTNSVIYIWGHSLGASLALRSAAELSLSNNIPKALILEAAFTTMREEIPVHPYGSLFSWLPWLDVTILNPLEANGFHFNNSKHILEVPCPIMMFHAEDDSVIPLTLGKKLNEIAQNCRNKTMGKTIYHQIPAEYGCDHYWLYIYPNLLNDIQDFLNMILTGKL